MSSNFFRVLGIPMFRGRDFERSDDDFGAAPTTILSYAFWQRAFAEQSEVIGSKIRIDGNSVAVIGVCPPWFRGLDLVSSPDYYLPVGTVHAFDQNNWFADRSHSSSAISWIRVLVRLADPADHSAAVAELTKLAALDGVDREFRFVPVARAALPDSVRVHVLRLLTVLAAVVGLLSLSAASSIALLLLVRAQSRQSEWLTRFLLGSGRGRIVAAITCEAGATAVLGATVGVPAFAVTVTLLDRFRLLGRVDLNTTSAHNVTIVVVCVALMLCGALLIGVIVGVLATRRTNLQRRSAPNRVIRLGTAAVALQVATTIVLVTGTLLLVRTFQAALRLNKSADIDTVLTAAGTMPIDVTTPSTGPSGVFEVWRDETRQRREIGSVSMFTSALTVPPSHKFTVDGRIIAVPSEVEFLGIDEMYFETMGLNPVRGRLPTESEYRTGADVVIISESGARTFGTDVVGRTLVIPTRPARLGTVVGVVPDIIRSVRDIHPVAAYIPLRMWPAEMRNPSRQWLAIRSGDESVAAAAKVATTTAERLGIVLVSPFERVGDQLMRELQPQQSALVGLTFVGCIAVGLSMVGAYSLADAMFQQQRRDLGIRAALGAGRIQLALTAMRPLAHAVAVGLVLAVVMIVISQNIVYSFLFRVHPLDGTSIITAVVTVIVFLWISVLRPIRMSMRPELAALIKAD